MQSVRQETCHRLTFRKAASTEDSATERLSKRVHYAFSDYTFVPFTLYILDHSNRPTPSVITLARTSALWGSVIAENDEFGLADFRRHKTLRKRRIRQRKSEISQAPENLDLAWESLLSQLDRILKALFQKANRFKFVSPVLHSDKISSNVKLNYMNGFQGDITHESPWERPPEEYGQDLGHLRHRWNSVVAQGSDMSDRSNGYLERTATNRTGQGTMLMPSQRLIQMPPPHSTHYTSFGHIRNGEVINRSHQSSHNVEDQSQYISMRPTTLQTIHNQPPLSDHSN
ncbi:hypothetical protein O181_120770 [Austropuccinia psidii MF-1]|uniref:Uncharacterized protein n=1 Tax=Austropuccinia psidii MF-1 TaxID=1389203 RepID=A0A9Q3KGD7_9BASI|nr:hypothetical protein [Austropuccinia psidii MF-1]